MLEAAAAQQQIINTTPTPTTLLPLHYEPILTLRPSRGQQAGHMAEAEVAAVVGATLAIVVTLSEHIATATTSPTTLHITIITIIQA